MGRSSCLDVRVASPVAIITGEGNLHTLFSLSTVNLELVLFFVMVFAMFDRFADIYSGKRRKYQGLDRASK
jgi:hypothetical protein